MVTEKKHRQHSINHLPPFGGIGNLDDFLLGNAGGTEVNTAQHNGFNIVATLLNKVGPLVFYFGPCRGFKVFISATIHNLQERFQHGPRKGFLLRVALPSVSTLVGIAIKAEAFRGLTAAWNFACHYCHHILLYPSQDRQASAFYEYVGLCDLGALGVNAINTLILMKNLPKHLVEIHAICGIEAKNFQFVAGIVAFEAKESCG
jgi:uncharacterized oligopeptide transporter (OPT) family protein